MEQRSLRVVETNKTFSLPISAFFISTSILIKAFSACFTAFLLFNAMSLPFLANFLSIYLFISFLALSKSKILPNLKIPSSIIELILLSKLFSFILYGNPGCGKTTISKLLSERLNRPMIDLDEYLVNKYKMTIPEMFDISENYFRERETECCQDASLLDGYIISTGGGVVKKEENIEYLKKNGIIIYIDRPIINILEDVDTASRPLLKDGPDMDLVEDYIFYWDMKKKLIKDNIELLLSLPIKSSNINIPSEYISDL